MNQDNSFEYGGYHFLPERRLTAEEDNFASISKRQRLDVDMGLCKENYAYPSKHPYSHEDFYAAATDKTCDLFRCVENGKLYIPCENDLQEYVEQKDDRGIEALREEALPVIDRLMIERFPSSFMEMPDSLIDAIVEDVFTDSAWQTEGRFSDDDVSLALQNELMICIREIYGRQPTQRYRQTEQNAETSKKGTVKLDALDIMKMSPLKVYQDMNIGDKSVMLGKIGAGEYKDKYVCSYTQPENGHYKYTDVTISEDYFEALSAFAQHIQEQTDRTRIEITAPFFNGTDLEAIGIDGCKPLTHEDVLVGKVVVIRADVLRPEYQCATHQLRLCVGGFGAQPFSRGSACFCKNLLTGEEGRFERDEILGTMKRDDLPLWAKQKLEAIQEKEKQAKRNNGEAR